MYHTKTILPSTLQLLKDLTALPELDKFALVGGTNLSLQLGHRLSIDLDLFTNEPANFDLIELAIQERFKIVRITAKNRIGLFAFIENIKVDLVYHKAPYIRPFLVQDDLRLASMDDVLAMKLNALAQRGLKKDFWDIAELFKTYSLVQMLELYEAKYANNEIGFIVKSLTYLADAEKSETPETLNGASWDNVKEIINKNVFEFMKKIK